MKPLVFERAWVSGVEHIIKNANVTSRIKVVGRFTPAVAKALEARWLLFDRENLPKAGYKVVELDYELKSLRAQFTPGGGLEAHKLDLTSELANHFKVIRQGDAKKGKKSALLVQFRVHYTGSPYEMLDYLLKVGAAEGKLELTPLQQEMFDQPAEKPAKGRKGKKANGAPEPVQTALPQTIPTDPNAPEWRTAEEIEAGVPHHILPAGSAEETAKAAVHAAGKRGK